MLLLIRVQLLILIDLVEDQLFLLLFALFPCLPRRPQRNLGHHELAQGVLSVIVLGRLDGGKVVFGVDAVYHFEVAQRVLLIAVEIDGLQIFLRPLLNFVDVSHGELLLDDLLLIPMVAHLASLEILANH